MKKKITLFISMIMALTMTFSLTACKDKTGGDGGLPPTLEQVVEKVQDMPVSTEENAIKNAIDEVFGVDVNLPEGTYNAQTYTVNGVSAYMVTVSGANTTASDYYNSIKAEMLAKGYTAEDSELAFYKVVGTVVYSAAVESDGNDVIIVFGAASPTSNPANPSNPSNPSNPNTPGSLPEGNLNAFPVTIINDMFSVLGITIPNCTSGSSYSIDSTYNSTENGIISITVTCYGMTADERDAYTDALKAAGFRSEYYLVYSHNNPYYSELRATRTFHDENQTFTISFTATYEEPDYVLPENVKITYNVENYNYFTAIKIGNDYYVLEEMSYDGTTMNFDSQLYYKWTGNGWELWEDYGDGWEKSSYGMETEMRDVEELIFDFITQEADIYEEAVQGENSTVLGKTVTVWNYDMGYGMSSKTYKDIESGIILKYETVMSGFTMTSTVTSIDITVTSFGDVELPQ